MVFEVCRGGVGVHPPRQDVRGTRFAPRDRSRSCGKLPVGENTLPFTHRGITIALFEVPDIERKTFNPETRQLESQYVVKAPPGRLLYNASSDYGETYALNPEQALADQKSLIDAALA